MSNQPPVDHRPCSLEVQLHFHLTYNPLVQIMVFQFGLIMLKDLIKSRYLQQRPTKMSPALICPLILAHKLMAGIA